jgi:hypothetical protein
MTTISVFGNYIFNINNLNINSIFNGVSSFITSTEFQVVYANGFYDYFFGNGFTYDILDMRFRAWAVQV